MSSQFFPPPLLAYQPQPLVTRKCIPIELLISCHNLTSQHALLKTTNPTCTVYECPPPPTQQLYAPYQPSYVLPSQPIVSTAPVKLGSTETIKGSLNPVFAQSIKIDYYFERQQVIRFEVLDDQGGDQTPKLIGSTEVHLGALLYCDNYMYNPQLAQPPTNRDLELVDQAKKRAGSISIIAQEVRTIAQPWSTCGSVLTDAEKQWLQAVTAAAAQGPPPGSSIDARRLCDQIMFILMKIPPSVPHFTPVISMSCGARHLDKKDIIGQRYLYFCFIVIFAHSNFLF